MTQMNEKNTKSTVMFELSASDLSTISQLVWSEIKSGASILKLTPHALKAKADVENLQFWIRLFDLHDRIEKEK